jgi:hypothetical protein
MADFRILDPKKTKHDAPHSIVTFGYDDDDDDDDYNDDTEHWWSDYLRGKTKQSSYT